MVDKHELINFIYDRSFLLLLGITDEPSLIAAQLLCLISGMIATPHSIHIILTFK